jgi:hypothetical protein
VFAAVRVRQRVRQESETTCDGRSDLQELKVRPGTTGGGPSCLADARQDVETRAMADQLADGLLS